MNKYSTINALTSTKVVAVIRGKDASEATELSKAAIEGGIKAIELTYTTPQIEDTFRSLKGLNVLLGAGSVLDSETARHAILNGAKFIVSSHFVEDVAKLCNRYGIPYMPGCMSIREMASALELGCDILKLFPAGHFDPSFIKAVNGPLPNVKIMPTGGINLDNMEEWINAGAVAIGIGSDLNKAYQNRGYEAVVRLSEKYIEKCSALTEVLS
ncbi:MULTISPECIES: bifunctional 2-keto-4-hydroxyglutarate aldolase/2-keto-3-deoxy-6-phosphogluconate aldolase [Priestia]|mgnify:CR=1 FL=1|jgi:2-dehydro-3-deoxyphosphogluconate aldolase / (4S)-4-hydroxy-2-oxoglutarate aldolase|uniref:bifunctional 2-keto-4-hydroxyglutarate aldolase/2-keto-3-deoxy-6-phosphogluconate aldolase n=1 Tax=Priestia TaxID=2800373 RepID=UPI0008E2C5BA|nr:MULTISPECIES: bifunctional 2-keto-4-hydroxyglutarate aldolase/2-keto-3-deoxy-6-phosphogluconate aldolase [Priestia]MBY0093826.1 bifunctional 2-keto-4-hydroxyglutarate aldolase/2-keto-3-deoxy-6-phosphogluconate aldolase [Priestia aryabhattai]MBY0105111.1 bifunctional 2-keto-4-hydroxyglutarate aldolase/2-keto-3-deoxy-6-phosphogluconate aldolase [Priestia aryabhattai]MCM3095871.1 bifunctional 2-keto-4-hydroxyglutarate aldolase/2-keto-3-deoxy-6-phosphogluconate aldolase [Priestia megaterium]MCM3